MRSTILFAIPLMLLITILQMAVLPRFPVFGLIPHLSFLIALAWGLLHGVNEGAIWGFIAGLSLDLFTVAPTGGLALTFMIAIGVACFIHQALPINRFVSPILLAALAILLQQILYFLFLQLFDIDLSALIATSLMPIIMLNSLLVLPIYWFIYLVERTFWPRAVEI